MSWKSLVGLRTVKARQRAEFFHTQGKEVEGKAEEKTI